MAAVRVIVPIFRMYVSTVDISRGRGLRRCSPATRARALGTHNGTSARICAPSFESMFPLVPDRSPAARAVIERDFDDEG